MDFFDDILTQMYSFVTKFFRKMAFTGQNIRSNIMKQ